MSGRIWTGVVLCAHFFESFSNSVSLLLVAIQPKLLEILASMNWAPDDETRHCEILPRKSQILLHFGGRQFSLTFWPRGLTPQ